MKATGFWLLLVPCALWVNQAWGAEKYRPMSVERLEWEYIQKVLQENNGNISAKACSLGMYRRILQHNLAKKRWPANSPRCPESPFSGFSSTIGPYRPTKWAGGHAASYAISGAI